MSNTLSRIKELEAKAVNMRLALMEMLEPGKVGHWGGSSSAMDIMAALYFEVMKVFPDDLKNPERDYFIMSKGHSVPAQYAALYELGLFPREELRKLKTLGGILQGHPDLMTPGIEAVTGSLGQGLSIGAGIAYARKIIDNADNRVFVMCGDGELGEGQLWEAASFASHYQLSNLTMILDNNGLQACGTCREILNIANIPDKWTAFGWEVIEIDGHDMHQILDALTRESTAKPKAIIAKTIKGKGFGFAENVVAFHNGAATEEQYAAGKKSLESVKGEIGA